jgi:hypothetical protein
MSQKGQTRTGKRHMEIAARRIRAMELRASGLGYQEIADRLGYSNPGTAYKDVHEGLRLNAAKATQDLRDVEADRLDRMTHALWSRAVGRAPVEADPERGIEADPGIPANEELIDRVLKIMQRRARLLGLDEPVRKDVTSSGQPVGYTFIRPVPPGQLAPPEPAHQGNGNVWEGERNDH